MLDWGPQVHSHHLNKWCVPSHWHVTFDEDMKFTITYLHIWSPERIAECCLPWDIWYQMQYPLWRVNLASFSKPIDTILHCIPCYFSKHDTIMVFYLHELICCKPWYDALMSCNKLENLICLDSKSILHFMIAEIQYTVRLYFLRFPILMNFHCLATFRLRPWSPS
jgi:hypothetical protein